ncbi:hypothetical protein [Streptomyces sp. I05A-00742]|uniref:hypothetical protein n=1 Tax=Streptomyces sp. I05A-00742 TaxID=2732853 RepID=UPI001487B82E|nr:hypothetical protein [Streptomyces sp. I05A-00742]
MSTHKPLAVAATTAACAALLVGATGTAATAATAPQARTVAAAPQADPDPVSDLLKGTSGVIKDLDHMLTVVPTLATGAVPLPGV